MSNPTVQKLTADWSNGQQTICTDAPTLEYFASKNPLPSLTPPVTPVNPPPAPQTAGVTLWNPQTAPLVMAVDGQSNNAVLVKGKNVTIPSIVQTGSSTALNFSGASGMIAEYVEAINAVGRTYGIYAGGDGFVAADDAATQAAKYIAAENVGNLIRTFNLYVAPGGMHGIRQHNHVGNVYGDPTAKLNVPSTHPGYGFAGYVMNDGPYDGAAYVSHEGRGTRVHRVKFGNNGTGGQCGWGPITIHIDDATRKNRSSERTSDEVHDGCEYHVGKLFLNFGPGTENLTLTNFLCRATGGICLNVNGPLTSKDKSTTWPGATNITLNNGRLYGDALVTPASLPYVSQLKIGGNMYYNDRLFTKINSTGAVS